MPKRKNRGKAQELSEADTDETYSSEHCDSDTSSEPPLERPRRARPGREASSLKTKKATAETLKKSIGVKKKQQAVKRQRAAASASGRQYGQAQ